MRLACALAFAGLATSGCLGPTYGTDKPAGEQLVDDITNLVALDKGDRPDIEYKPRPQLITPEDRTKLPPPQERVAVTDQANWPESPEARRARIRAAADAGDQETAMALASNMDIYPRNRTEIQPIADEKERTAEFRRRLAESKQGSSDTRKYLSDPPLGYRQPANTAPVGDTGIDESVKEAKRKAGGKPTVGEFFGKLWPF